MLLGIDLVSSVRALSSLLAPQSHWGTCWLFTSQPQPAPGSALISGPFRGASLPATVPPPQEGNQTGAVYKFFTEGHGTLHKGPL